MLILVNLQANRAACSKMWRLVITLGPLFELVSEAKSKRTILHMWSAVDFLIV